jgi:hypothetical protein
MKIIFIKNHDNFVVGNICDILTAKANQLIKLGYAQEYHGQNVEVYPQQQQEPEKEMVYVPIIVPENELYSMQEEYDEQDFDSDEKPIKNKTKIK